MEKISEYDRLLDAQNRKRASYEEFLQKNKLLRRCKETRILYENAKDQRYRDYLYGEVDEADNNFHSFCEYYGLGRYDINQLIEEL